MENYLIVQIFQKSNIFVFFQALQEFFNVDVSFLDQEESRKILEELTEKAPRQVLQTYCARRGLPFSITDEKIDTKVNSEEGTKTLHIVKYEAVCAIGDRTFRGFSVIRKKDAIDAAIIEALTGYFDLDYDAVKPLIKIKPANLPRADLEKKNAVQILNEICSRSQIKVEFVDIEEMTSGNNQKIFAVKASLDGQDVIGSGTK